MGWMGTRHLPCSLAGVWIMVVVLGGTGLVSGELW